MHVDLTPCNIASWGFERVYLSTHDVLGDLLCATQAGWPGCLQERKEMAGYASLSGHLCEIKK